MNIFEFLQTWYFGAWNPSILATVGYTLVMTHVTIVAVTVYLHRHSAHRSVDLHPAVRHFFRAWLWLTTGMNTRSWTAIHRKHHARTDVDGDPHSPHIAGLWALFVRGSEIYREADTEATRTRYGKGTPEDWLERNVYSRHPTVGIGLMLLIDVMLFGVVGSTVWAVQMMWIPFFAMGIINGVGHCYGYRNFTSKDRSTNVSPWGILIGGEELHNNHHTYPNSAKLSVHRWEFDVGWMWIRMLTFLHLAYVMNRGPIVARIPGKQTVDLDTALGAFNDRARVMANYATTVLKPVIKLERQRALLTGGTARRVRRALRRHLPDDSTLEDNSALIRSNAALSTAIGFKSRLAAIWTNRNNGDEFLASFSAWCRDAEASQIEALRTFVRDLKTYSLPRPA